MDNIPQELFELLQKSKNTLQPETLIKLNNGDYIHRLPDSDSDFKDMILLLFQQKFQLISLYCAENFENHNGFTLFFVFEAFFSFDTQFDHLFILYRNLTPPNKTLSIASIFPSASWYEREIRDGFGVDFTDAFDKRRLFLHEIYPDDFHPLVKSFKNGPLNVMELNSPKKEYPFLPIEGHGVYQIPVGPVHAGIIAPGHFRFSVIGETIYNLEVRMFYTHRGVEKLAEGLSPQDVIAIAESIAGDETVANAVAYCMALESIFEITEKISPKIWFLRTIFLELERIYSLLGDLAGMIVDVAFATGASPFFIFREDIFRYNEKLTGSRFMKGMIAIGGLKKDVSHDKLLDLNEYLIKFVKKFDKAVKRINNSSTVIDRFETAGIVKKELKEPLHLTGPIVRAIGIPIDARMQHPYGLYKTVHPSVQTSENGDVFARFTVKVKEIHESIKIIQNLINHFPANGNGKISTPYTVKDGYSTALVEAPRGQSFHWVYIRNGKVDRYKVRTPSFNNWQAIQHTVLGNIVPDFPLINKSMNLSYAGTDL